MNAFELPGPISRRSFLARAAGVAAGVAASAVLPGVAAASSLRSDVARNASMAAKYGSASIAFSWLENVQQAGSYIAEQRGYYLDEGLDVMFIPGGDTYAGEPLVVSGKALLAMTSPTSSAQALLNGAPVTIVGAQYQKNPVCVITLKKSGITMPAQLVGKSIGYGPNIATQLNGFLTANKLTGKVKLVLTSKDASILTAGEVDAYIGWITNDVVSLEVAGVAVNAILFAEHGLPGFYLTYCAKTSDLSDKLQRERIMAMLKGEILGWQVQTANPAIGLALTLDHYGKGLGLNTKQQTLQAHQQNGLVESPTTFAHGLFWMSEEDIAGTVSSLRLLGTKVSDSLFDNSLLAEIYDGKAKLAL
jgi:ABC-type nitrate/sulfonate/bicarbonate transport system substrate-binding protein